MNNQFKKRCLNDQTSNDDIDSSGPYVFQITATEAGLESARSDPVTKAVDISKIGKMLVTVEVVE